MYEEPDDILVAENGSYFVFMDHKYHKIKGSRTICGMKPESGLIMLATAHENETCPDCLAGRPNEVEKPVQPSLDI